MNINYVFFVLFQGRQFDYKGDLKEWWEPETRLKFLEKSKCIIHQYGNYTAPEVNLSVI